jgi:hypothetical protein
LLFVLASSTFLAGDDRSAPHFFDDDPLEREPESQDASGAEERDIDVEADLVVNLFSRPGDPTPDVRAQNVNTIDEVPDSSWFTNRIYANPLTIEELRRGPNTLPGPAPGRWTVIKPKTSGVAPGFTVRDENGEVWFLSFDPEDYPNAPTGAIAVATRIFWALGYNQVESYLTRVHPQNLVVAPDAEIKTRGGIRRMTMDDVEEVLGRAAEGEDGSHRVMAGRAVPGKILGPFRYHGTRPDDPNDVVPHEHRRELRALKVFGAWTNLVDLKANNTLDTLVPVDGRGVVRHYLQDVGSGFGTGALGPHQWDEGHEYLFEADALLKRLFSFGFYIRPWQTVNYPDLPEAGRFEAEAFDPDEWRPRVPTGAFLRARDDDNFWAALRVMAFTDEMIRAVAREARLGDEAAEEWIADVLIQRRDKIGQTYLPRINPLVRFSLDGSGALRFENAATEAGFAAPPARGYRAVWYRFDNDTGASHPIGETTATDGRTLKAPALPADAAFLKIEVSALDPPHASWTLPVEVYFRRTASGWKLVGLERRLPSAT